MENVCEREENNKEIEKEKGVKQRGKGWLIAKLVAILMLAMGLVMATVCIKNGESFSGFVK